MHLCGADGLLIVMDPEQHQRQLKKKQKNRVAARRSRQKHTDRADALHQHESLEKHNHSLRKEIQALQAELVQWSRTLQLHERLCPMDYASCSTLVPPDCWDQAKGSPGLVPHGPHGHQEQLGLVQTPISSPPAQHLSPDPQPHDSPSPLPSPLPLQFLDPTVAATPPAKPSPNSVLSALFTGSSLRRSSPGPSALLPSPAAQPASAQPHDLEHLTGGRPGSSPHSPSSALGLTHLQSREHRPVSSAADRQGLGVDASTFPLLAFPLLSSAQVHF
ncbi:basic leucine zipper transcriptional factor ATF-like 2 isoform X2 [Tupaia chinensis]|uniref:basic leucine zipper transcriptional factor ATF-like 2 isoform X2 n=1 Tax=Tupaia chinensis TaxID=246437 RepID=UPI000703EBEB|nr:basic leucine zipper transcriptional factor ATF-like 2 isoform X2 [Tupaia chinensis]